MSVQHNPPPSGRYPARRCPERTGTECNGGRAAVGGLTGHFVPADP